MPATNSAQDLYSDNVEPTSYVPFFPPCRPCGHCPACGRGYDLPMYPPYYVPRTWPSPGLPNSWITYTTNTN